MTTRKAKVMIVDDSALVRAWAETVLRGAGYEVVSREVALGAGSMVLRERPDLLILDVSMPALDGDQLAQIIRKREVGTRLPIVLFSTLPADELNQRSTRCGADGFIPKTDDAAEFLRQVAAYVPPVLQREAPVEQASAVPVLVVGAEALQFPVAMALAPAAGATTTVVATDHEAAVRIAAEIPYAFVVLDAGSTAPEDLETLQVARERATPVLLLCAQLQEEVIRRANALGVSHVLPAYHSAAPFKAAVLDLLRCRLPQLPGLACLELPPRVAVQATVHLASAPPASAVPPIEAVTWDLDDDLVFLCSRHAPPLHTPAQIALAPSSRKKATLFHCEVVQLRLQPVGLFPRGFGASFAPQTPAEAQALRAEVKALAGKTAR